MSDNEKLLYSLLRIRQELLDLASDAGDEFVDALNEIAIDLIVTTTRLWQLINFGFIAHDELCEAGT
jgi:hypothetical protein